MQSPPQVGSLRKTWNRSGVIPDRVLPEPVSPVMSQPRQKSARVHLKPASRTTARCSRFRERCEIRTDDRRQPKNAHSGEPESRTHIERPMSTPAIAASATITRSVTKRTRFSRSTFCPKRRSSPTRSDAWLMNDFDRRSSSSIVPRKSSKLGIAASWLSSV